MKTHGRVKDSFYNYIIGDDGKPHFYPTDRGRWDMRSPWYPGKKSVPYWKWRGRIRRWTRRVAMLALALLEYYVLCN